MRRRQFIAMLGVGGSLGLAGCTGNQSNQKTTTTSPPTTTKTTTATKTMTAAVTEMKTPTPKEGKLSEEERDAMLKSFLQMNGVDVTSVARKGGNIELKYRSNAKTKDDIVKEMGMVAGAYIGLVKEGEAASQMNVTVLGPNDKAAGTYHVKHEWAVKFNNGEMSAEQVSLKVLQTLRVTNK